MVHGIAEFLDIFSSIINGFSIPVKEEHKAFLRNVLLPLHKCDKYEVYFQQLADCCVLFVNKDQTIATTVLAGLLKVYSFESVFNPQPTSLHIYFDLIFSFGRDCLQRSRRFICGKC